MKCAGASVEVSRVAGWGTDLSATAAADEQLADSGMSAVVVQRILSEQLLR
jgi:hypothetical protein